MIRSLADASIGKPITRGGVSFFPVFLHQPSLQVLSGAAEHLEIRERPGAQVPTLHVSNRRDVPVLISEGETLNGGWQNRVVNVSVLVSPNSEVAIPVSCVEAGRWGGHREFVGRGPKAPRRVRRTTSSSVTRNLRSAKTRQSDQLAVWEEVDHELGRAGVKSATRAVEHLSDRERHDEILRRAITNLVNQGPQPGQCGVVVSHGRQVVAADVYGTPELFADSWEMIVRSSLLENVDSPQGSPSANKALIFLDRCSRKIESVNAGVGLGTEYRLASSNLTGQALVVDDVLIHASAFALVP